jgi:hypothetical protein
LFSSFYLIAIDTLLPQTAPWLLDPPCIRGMQRPLKSWSAAAPKATDRVVQVILTAPLTALGALIRKVVIMLMTRLSAGLLSSMTVNGKCLIHTC